jgi:hypothetical protein
LARDIRGADTASSGHTSMAKTPAVYANKLFCFIFLLPRVKVCCLPAR